MIRRRSLIAGLGALLAAPAIIRTPGLLMKVKPLPVAPWLPMYAGESVLHFRGIPVRVMDVERPDVYISRSEWNRQAPDNEWRHAVRMINIDREAA